jgi:hypothetical protein
MRALLVLLTASTVGTGAFALNELSALHHPVTVVAAAPPAGTQLPTPTLEVRAEAPSSWRGPLPFGGVPAPPVAPIVAANTDDVDSDDVIDESDRCPDEPEDRDGREDDDGCPERVTTIEPGHIVLIDPEPEEEFRSETINIY